MQGLPAMATTAPSRPTADDHILVSRSWDDLLSSQQLLVESTLAFNKAMVQKFAADRLTPPLPRQGVSDVAWLPHCCGSFPGELLHHQVVEEKDRKRNDTEEEPLAPFTVVSTSPLRQPLLPGRATSSSSKGRLAGIQRVAFGQLDEETSSLQALQGREMVPDSDDDSYRTATNRSKHSQKVFTLNAEVAVSKHSSFRPRHARREVRRKDVNRNSRVQQAQVLIKVPLPPPAMGASAGYGQVVHDGICAMHKLGIQVSPSPDMMAIMDAKDTLCQVAILSICSEDMLVYYTADEFATGFKKRPAFQLRGIRQNRGSSCEGIWITKRQPGSSCPSPDVRPFVGSKDMLCRVAILNIGWEDTLAHKTMEESAIGFTKSLAFQRHGVKHSRGSSGEGIWTAERFGGHTRTLRRGRWLQEDAGFPTVRHQAEPRRGVWIIKRNWAITASLTEGVMHRRQGLMAFMLLLRMMSRYHLVEGRPCTSEFRYVDRRHRPCAIFDFVVGMGQLFRLLVTSHPCRIAVDTDLNKSKSVWEAPYVFLLAENFFCFVFTMELIICLGSFQSASQACEGWFLFDSSLTIMMIWDTWVSFLVEKISGHNVISSQVRSFTILRVLRILRIARVARAARIINSLPELRVLVKGMVIAMRSTCTILALLLIVVYIFAILFVQLLADSQVGQGWFENVPQAMNFLLLQTLAGADVIVINKLLAAGWTYYLLYLAFVFMGSLTLMNMLIGVLCEVVGVVAQIEEERAFHDEAQLYIANFVNVLDIDGDQKLSKLEFLQLMERDPDLHHVCIKACRYSAPVPTERRRLRSGSLLASWIIVTTSGWTLVELSTGSVLVRRI
ncbi:Scn11a [Symbiodinium sp. CCMP2456]|nr:Scn11a [Symbiodinium sp. CCMP2456]